MIFLFHDIVVKMYRIAHNLLESIERYTGNSNRNNNNNNSSLQTKQKVLVVGYGWGGKAFCDNIDRKKYDVHILTAKPFFLNTPKLIQGVVTRNNSIVKNKIIGPVIHLGTCQKVSPTLNEVEATVDMENISVITPAVVATAGPITKIKLGYDYLVLAVGSVPNTFGIEGADTCKFLKTFDDMRLLQDELDANKTKTVNIIGAGPTGIELALALRRDVRVIEAAPSILNGFSEETKEAIRKELKAYNIDLKLNTKVVKIGTDYIATADNKVFDRGITVWTSGVKQPPLIDALTGGRRLVVNKFLNIDGYKNIYAVGDINGSGPPTAQNASAQGIFLAEHFNRGLEESGDGYKYVEKGRIIHGADAIYVEYAGTTRIISLPKVFGFIVDSMTAP